MTGKSITDASYRFFNNGIITDSLQNQFTITNSTTGYSIGGNIAYTEPVGKVADYRSTIRPLSKQRDRTDPFFLTDRNTAPWTPTLSKPIR